jgi:hypothetical protein
MNPDEAWHIAMQAGSDARRDGAAISDAAEVMRTTYFELIGYKEDPQEESES